MFFEYPTPNGGAKEEIVAERKLQEIEKELVIPFHSETPLRKIIEKQIDDLEFIRQLDPTFKWKDDYPRTFRIISELDKYLTPKIDILVYYAHKNWKMAEEFETHLKILKRTLPIQCTFINSPFMASDINDLNSHNVKRNLDDAHFLIVLTCRDLVAWPLFDALIHPNATKRTLSKTVTALYLIGRPFYWDGYPEITATKYLPWRNPPVPISEHKNMDSVFVEIVQELERMLRRLPSA